MTERAPPTGDLVISTERGLYCPAGDFYIDPWRPVERAVITHAHADHLRRGCGHYLTATPGVGLVRARMKRGADVRGLAYGESIAMNGVRCGLHPAGHMLGSAQVRLEYRGEVWAVSGDYKRQADPTCAAFEPLRCDVFITESTFASPEYRWPPAEEVVRAMDAWRRENARAGRTSALLAYAVGKAQRLLALLDPTLGPFVVHPDIENFNALYREAGAALPRTHAFDAALIRANRGAATLMIPPRFAGTRRMKKIGGVALGRASGWASGDPSARPGTGNTTDAAGVAPFVLSDHADREEILRTIAETGAQRVGVLHGQTAALIATLRERGLEAWHLATRYRDCTDAAAIGLTERRHPLPQA